MKSLLVKDTTREDREKIINQGLAVCGGACDLCGGCDNIGGGRIESIYEAYIKGEKELAEVNMEYRANLVMR